MQQWEAEHTAPRRGAVRTRLAQALSWSEEELEFGPPTDGEHPTLSDEAQAIAEAFMELTAAQQAYYTEAVFRDVTLTKLARRLPGGPAPVGGERIRRTDAEEARAAILSVRRAARGE